MLNVHQEQGKLFHLEVDIFPTQGSQFKECVKDLNKRYVCCIASSLQSMYWTPPRDEEKKYAEYDVEFEDQNDSRDDMKVDEEGNIVR